MTRKTLLASALALALASPALAADDAAATTAGDDALATLDAVQVSASTSRLPFSEAAMPNTITVINRARIEQMPPEVRASLETELRRVADLLQSSLGEIKTSLGTMRPPEFRRRPLVSVLQGLIMQHESLTGVSVELPQTIRCGPSIALMRRMPAIFLMWSPLLPSDRGRKEARGLRQAHRR